MMQRGQQMAEKQYMRMAAVILIGMTLLLGCGSSTATPTPPPDGIVDTAAELVTALQAEGFVAQHGGRFNNFLFERGGQLLLVNGQQVQVWEFATNEQADAAQDSILGDDSPLARLNFTAPPRFFQNGRMVVLFVATDPAILRTLTDILGDPFL